MTFLFFQLVGGFAANDYLTSRVYDTFHSRIPLIARPKDCDVSTLQGAARYGLGLISGKPAVSSVIAPRSYLMKVRSMFSPILDVSDLPLSRSASFRRRMRIDTSDQVRSLFLLPLSLQLIFLPLLPLLFAPPGFITTNSAGVEVCENRLSYLVAKNGPFFCSFSSARR